ncbi:MAG TPA: cytochrome c [Gammaproteobacteria bacterium]
MASMRCAQSMFRLIPAAAVLLSAAVASAQTGAAADGPGWTGATHPDDVIAARRGLMIELEEQMRPIDSHAAGETADPEQLRNAARAIAAMLGAVPHLFPPSTNRYDPEAENPATLALPAVWEDFEAFYAFAGAAKAAAVKMADTTADADLPAAAQSLRGACDACHSAYMRAYTAPKVTPEDLEFDFDSLFEPSVE